MGNVQNISRFTTDGGACVIRFYGFAAMGDGLGDVWSWASSAFESPLHAGRALLAHGYAASDGGLYVANDGTYAVIVALGVPCSGVDESAQDAGPWTVTGYAMQMGVALQTLSRRGY